MTYKITDDPLQIETSNSVLLLVVNIFGDSEWNIIM
jgi:hypothetical protein